VRKAESISFLDLTMAVKILPWGFLCVFTAGTFLLARRASLLFDLETLPSVFSRFPSVVHAGVAAV
jgi:hypothetical protein